MLTSSISNTAPVTRLLPLKGAVPCIALPVAPCRSGDMHRSLGDWQQDGATLVGHTDWVRDVAWAPNLGLPKTIIASAGQDGKVLIWKESRDIPGQWAPALLHDFKV